MEWITEARALSQGLGVVVLSADADAHRISAAFDAGASAYVLKGAAPEDLALAIRQVFEHSIFIGFTPPSSGHDQPANGPRLTRRELEVLQLVTRGASNAAVAKTLWVTEQTVKFHLSNVYRKLSVSNRTEASRWAYLHGLVGNGASGDHADPPAANGSSSSENGAGVVSAAAGGRP
jgi:DNA-binding NarL/FixJ family response regulator